MFKSLENLIDPWLITSRVTLKALHKILDGENLDPKQVAKAKAGRKAAGWHLWHSRLLEFSSYPR